VVLSVYAGEYDIGTIREGTLNVVADKIDISEIRVIANTRWYPSWVYSARSDLEPKFVKKIMQAFSKLDYNKNEHRQILNSADINSIIPAQDNDFNPVRNLISQIAITLDE